MPYKGAPGGGADAFTPPFSRPVAVDRLPSAGQKLRIEANGEERAALARLYGVEEIRRLEFDCEIKPRGKGRYHLRGRMEGEVVQACVITLEPVEEKLAETVDLDFWPLDAIGEPRMGAIEVTELEIEGSGPPEPLIDGVIDVGAIAAEFLASSMNPYPRKQGAAFNWSGETADETAPEPEEDRAAGGPFSALKKLKRP